jgi:hypothetical protein
MSLMQLLTVTRSIKTVKNQPSPYRMKQEHLLPKFSPAKEGEEEASAGEASAAPVEGQTPAPVVTAQTPKIGFFSRWLRFGKRSRGRARPRGDRMPVQTELLLEAVRVVRNDFSESALFSSSHREAHRPKPQAVGGHWWLRVQARLFGARRKQS